MIQHDRTRVVIVGLFVGLALNLTGWLGNNLLLGSLWASVEVAPGGAAWRATPWSDVFSLAPDVVYGLAIASFALVVVTKIPLALAAGWILEA